MCLFVFLYTHMTVVLLRTVGFNVSVSIAVAVHTHRNNHSDALLVFVLVHQW